MSQMQVGFGAAMHKVSPRKAMKARPNPRKAVAMAGSLISIWLDQPTDGQEFLQTLLPQEGMLFNLTLFTPRLADKAAKVDVTFQFDDGTGLNSSFVAKVNPGRSYYDLSLPVSAGTIMLAKLSVVSDTLGGLSELYISMLYCPKPSPENIVLVDITKENAIETLATLRAQGRPKPD